MAMGVKKLKSSSRSLKYRPTAEPSRKEFKGTKPLAERASIPHIIFMMWIQLCRKIMYGVPTSSKVGLYIIGTLILSILSEFSSFSETKNYLSNPHNIFNIYGVKYGWGWTLAGTLPFITSTSIVLKGKSIPYGMIRLAIATGIWFVSTCIFQSIESTTGICNSPQYYTKLTCRRAGFNWSGFDVSGHSFLLIWNNLFILEEARSYIGWEKIKEILRNEEYRRVSSKNPNETSKDVPSTGLSKLKIEDFLSLRKNYTKITPVIRYLYCFLAGLVLLWDIMLICTALYFHVMIEKVLGALTAVVCWFFLYQFLYEKVGILPGQTGVFKYVSSCEPIKPCIKRDRKKLDRSASWSETDSVPKFMGMPIYNYRGRDNFRNTAQESVSPNTRSDIDTSLRRSSMDISVQRGLKTSKRSRSISKSRLNATSFTSLNKKYNQVSF